MTYEVKVGKRVRKEIARFPRKDQERILAEFEALAEDPRPRGCEPVKTAEPGTYRVRVGGSRIIYTVVDDEQEMVVARVARRGKATYKGI